MVRKPSGWTETPPTAPGWYFFAWRVTPPRDVDAGPGPHYRIALVEAWRNGRDEVVVLPTSGAPAHGLWHKATLPPLP